jgi:hypothetical protein
MRRGEGAARAFFTDVLGMTEIDKPPVLAARGGAWFRAGGVELHMGVEDGFRPAAKADPGILVGTSTTSSSDCAPLARTSAGTANFPGHRRVYSHDPFGNRLEFLEASS